MNKEKEKELGVYSYGSGRGRLMSKATNSKWSQLIFLLVS